MTYPQMPQPVPYYAPPPPAKRNVATMVLRGCWLSMLWMVQYCLFVPTVLGWRMLAGAFKLGMVGIIWLCVPVVGWVILAVMLLGHPAPHRSNIWRPWGIGRR